MDVTLGLPRLEAAWARMEEVATPERVARLHPRHRARVESDRAEAASAIAESARAMEVVLRARAVAARAMVRRWPARHRTLLWRVGSTAAFTAMLWLVAPVGGAILTAVMAAVVLVPSWREAFFVPGSRVELAALLATQRDVVELHDRALTLLLAVSPLENAPESLR